MKTKTLIQLLSLSSSLYAITKDEELMEKISEIGGKGKQKLNDLYEDFTGDGEEELTEKILTKIRQTKEEISRRLEETLAKAYEKMHIAHTNEIHALEEKLEGIKKELALAEARIVNLESAK